MPGSHQLAEHDAVWFALDEHTGGVDEHLLPRGNHLNINRAAKSFSRSDGEEAG